MADCAVTVENLEKYVSDCRQKFETEANSFIDTDFESRPQTTVGPLRPSLYRSHFHWHEY